MMYKSLPCVKGGGFAEGVVMQRKHNVNMVSKAQTLRKNMTKEERHLCYDFLHQYPVRFYRQKVLGRYIVDFYCAEAKLVIELDGSQHYDEEYMRQDAERTAFLEPYGLSVIRFPNNAITLDFCGVCEYIDKAVQQAFGINR